MVAKSEYMNKREQELVAYTIQLVNSGWPNAYVWEQVDKKAGKLNK